MKIFLGADHNGFELKEALKKYLRRAGFDFEDLGNRKLDLQDDYPDFAQRVAQKVAQEKAKGILICGSGIGVCIVANRFRGVRAAQVFNEQQAKKAKEDDDVNILCLAGREIDKEKAKKIVRAWLQTKFSRLARHQRRLNKIQKLEPGI